MGCGNGWEGGDGDVCLCGWGRGGADAVTSLWLLYTQGMEPTVLHIPAAENCLSVYRSEEEEQEKNKTAASLNFVSSLSLSVSGP